MQKPNKPASKRSATVERRTKETAIFCAVDLDGTGAYDIATGVGFLDHMIEQLARHSLIDITLKAEGDLRTVANDIAAIPEVSYVVVVSGSFDLLMEVVCEDDDHLLALLNDKVRTVAGVRSTESFTYLRLFKQTYAWGTR